MAKIVTLFMTKTAKKPLPFGAAHTYITHIGEYPPPGVVITASFLKNLQHNIVFKQLEHQAPPVRIAPLACVTQRRTGNILNLFAVLVRVTSGQKLYSEVIYTVLQTSVQPF